ncbi:MAG TPA: DUF115 domain-containing protein, partial [Synergistaceae bacterium]|nr:DUF115 domain-containing protein [Synergistaceae bacterium]
MTTRENGSFLEKNLAVLKKRWPQFAQWLREKEDRRGALTVRKSGNALWLVGEDERMIDRYDVPPGALADPTHAIWVVLGLGTGEALLPILQKAGLQVARIFLLETDAAVWWAALAHADLSGVLEDPRFFPLWDQSVVRTQLFEGSSTTLLLGLWRHPLYVKHQGEMESRQKGLAEDFAKIRDYLFIVLRSMGNSAEDTLVGFRQMMMNIPGMLESHDITDLIDAFKDYPAIIVGAGPSLDKNYKLLHEVRDKAVIISSDTALRKLLADDIHPHIVVSLERGLIIYQKHFADLPKIPEGTVLFVQSVCVPEMAGTWQGGPFCLGFKWGLPLDHWFSGL